MFAVVRLRRRRWRPEVSARQTRGPAGGEGGTARARKWAQRGRQRLVPAGLVPTAGGRGEVSEGGPRGIGQRRRTIIVGGTSGRREPWAEGSESSFSADFLKKTFYSSFPVCVCVWGGCPLAVGAPRTVLRGPVDVCLGLCGPGSAGGSQGEGVWWQRTPARGRASP